jgi:hypothetical protein
MINDVRVTTWSHTSYSDVWKMYYGQFAKHAPFLKHALMVNASSPEKPENCVEILNNEDNKLSQRLVSSLEKIEEKQVIYMQEDFVLYDDVDKGEMEKLISFLNESDYSFIRLIKSGVEGGICLDESLGIYEVPRNCRYFYSLQATLWKKQDLINLYNFFRPSSFVEAENFGSHAIRNLNMKGCYIYRNEPRRSNHYDSLTFPYMATAIIGGSYGGPGRWQTSLYKKELDPLFKEYDIDVSIRGEK